MKFIMKSINYLLVLLFLFVLISFTWHSVPPLKTCDPSRCSIKYPLTETYEQLSLNHRWSVESIPFKGIASHKNGMKDGIQIYSNYEYNEVTQRNELFSGIDPIRHNHRHGIYFGYSDEVLDSINYYKEGEKDGIHFSFQKEYPSLVVVYSKDENKGLVDFWEYGRIRGIKFGSNYKDGTREGGKDNDTYDNGQKAFEYIEENGTKYWVIYDPKGEMLVKYPTDNDFCKAEFYEDGKKVEIPYFFDQKEFEGVYEKIKNMLTSFDM